MSGGIPDDDDDGKDYKNDAHTTRQIVFTIVGSVTPAQKKEWNDCVKKLKGRFGTQLHAVTTIGVKTPKAQKPGK